MSFADISSKIIKESINAAVYIDDKVLLPFEAPTAELKNQSDLFNSFKTNNCYLDFVRFNVANPINTTQVLNNKDLLILDWHLNSNESNLTATFDILKSAIKTPSIHFSVIYTDQRKAALPQNVILNIASYFSGLDKNIAASTKVAFTQLLEETGLSNEDQQVFKDNLKGLITELFFEIKNKEKNKVIGKDLNDLLTKTNIKESFNKFLSEQQFPTKIQKEQLICLSFILNDCDTPKVAEKFSISLSPDRFTIRINNLFIKVFSKDIKDTELYNEFTKSLVAESNIFLTLLGLEIRNRFRETSGFIGKELDEVNPLAFFFHRKSHFDGNEELFNEFLKDIWKDQVASFLLEKDIELFSVIEEFETANDIDAKLSTFNNADEFSRLALAKLNFVYNRLSIKRKENDEIRFGDIFWVDLGNDAIVYLLCLTPHCDCLRPTKIKNQFFFVEGADIGIAKGVMKSDGDFISYIVSSNNNLTCIDWTNGTEDCKPFSFYIENNRMAGDDKQITFNYRGENKAAFYLCTLKENYAQRISNKAFSYPLRIGIDFATFRK
jgi:hypothetical protein